MRIFKILVVFALLFVAGNLFFEYCISREVPSAIQFVATIAMLALAIFSIRFIIKQTIKLLKL